MSDIGIKLGIEGEKEFKKALSDINQQFKVLGSEMKLATSEFDKNEKSVRSLTSKNEVLTKEIDAQKDKIETLQRALNNASDSFGENDRRTQAWVVQLNNAKAELNSMERELKDNERALDDVANEMNDAERQTDQFGDEVTRAARKSDDAEDKFKKLGNVMKGVGTALAAGVAAIGAAAVAAGKALVDMAVESAAYADEILTQSSITGMSTESLQAYSYAAELVDVSLETLTGSMAKNIKSMSNAAQGSAKFADAYATLGVSVTNTDGSLRDSEQVYWEVIDALTGVSNETERDALAMQLFGKKAQELNPLIQQGSAGIAALTDEAYHMGAVMGEDTITQLGKFDDSVQRLKRGGEAAKRVIGTVLLPQLQSLADDGTDLLSRFTTSLSEAGGDFGKISEVLGSTVGGIAEMVVDNLPKLIQVGMDMVSAIGTAIMDNLSVIGDCAVKVITSFSSGINDALPKLAEAALQLVLALVESILSNLSPLIDAALKAISVFAKGLGEALPELIPAVVMAIVTVVETIFNNLDLLLEAAFAIIKGLVEGILAALPMLIDALPRLITTIVDFVTENLPVLVEMGIQLIIQLAIGIIEALPELCKSLPQVIAAIVQGLGGVLSSVFEIGKNIVVGLWNGIASLAGWIWEKVKGFFVGIVDGVKRVLGINSPSRVFAGIGENMGAGLGSGFTDAMKGVRHDMEQAIPTNFDVDMNSALAGPDNIAGGSAHTVDVTIPLTIDGNILSRVVSQLQWNRNTVTIRNLGTV